MKLRARHVAEDKTSGKHFYLPVLGSSVDMFAPGGTTCCFSCTCCTCAAVGITSGLPPRNN
jgi:hypothetical protein